MISGSVSKYSLNRKSKYTLKNNSVFGVYHRLTVECWDKEPHRRPTFGQIIERLEHISSHLASEKRWEVSLSHAHVFVYPLVSVYGKNSSLTLEKFFINIGPTYISVLYVSLAACLYKCVLWNA